MRINTGAYTGTSTYVSSDTVPTSTTSHADPEQCVTALQECTPFAVVLLPHLKMQNQN